MLKENIDCNAYDFNQIDGQSLLMVILIIFNFFLTKPYNIIEFLQSLPSRLLFSAGVRCCLSISVSVSVPLSLSLSLSLSLFLSGVLCLVPVPVRVSVCVSLFL